MAISGNLPENYGQQPVEAAKGLPVSPESLLSSLKAGRCWIEVTNNRPHIHKDAEFFEEIGTHDRQTAAYITSLISDVLDPDVEVRSEDIQKVFELAEFFDKTIYERESFAHRSIVAEANEPMEEIHRYVRAHKTAAALKIDERFFISHPDAFKFIQDNVLMYRIDGSYVERGMGPKIDEDLDLVFPVNHGTHLEPHVVWTRWQDIPVDSHNKVKWGYGPFGFEPGVHPITPAKITPIRLVDMPPDVEIKPGQALMEIVTSKGEKTLAGFIQKIMKGGPGHSWIRVYEPELDRNGRPTGKCFQYSFGAGIGTKQPRMFSPDVREFKGDKTFTARVMMQSDTWSSVKQSVENLQQAYLKHAFVDKNTHQVYEELKEGTCVNFALYTFGLAYKEAYGKALNVDGNTVWQTHIFIPLKNISKESGLSSLLSRVVPVAASRLTSVLMEGYMPWVLIDQLEKRVDQSTGMLDTNMHEE